jgi:hypothetical protein
MPGRPAQIVPPPANHGAKAATSSRGRTSRCWFHACNIEWHDDVFESGPAGGGTALVWRLAVHDRVREARLVEGRACPRDLALLPRGNRSLILALCREFRLGADERRLKPATEAPMTLSLVDKRGDEAAASGTGPASLNADKVNVVKVFSVTKAKDRESLGEVVTAWIARNPGVRVLKTFVTLSSDSAFHCLSIVLVGTRPPDAP